MMKDLQKMGGIAALIAAGTYLVGFALLFALLIPAGYDSAEGDSVQSVAFLTENQTIMYLWNLIIYIVNSIVLVVLALALYDRLKHGAPAMAQIASAFGLIWAGLVLASGMLANIGLSAVVDLYAKDPDRAAALWQALTSVEEGIGGGNEIAGGLWILLLSWAGLRATELPRALNYLGILIGVAGLFTIIPALVDIGGPIFGLGFIVWFIWVGVAMLRGSSTAQA